MDKLKKLKQLSSSFFDALNDKKRIKVKKVKPKLAILEKLKVIRSWNITGPVGVH